MATTTQPISIPISEYTQKQDMITLTTMLNNNIVPHENVSEHLHRILLEESLRNNSAFQSKNSIKKI